MKRLVCGRRKFGYIGFSVREQVLLPSQRCQPGRGGGGMLCGTRRHQGQLHALCLEWKIGKPSTSLCALTLKCFSWHALAWGAKGSCYLTCVESSWWWHFQSSGAAGSLFRLLEMWKTQLPVGQGWFWASQDLFCITTMAASGALPMLQWQRGRDCAPFSEEKKWFIFRKSALGKA